MTGRHLSRLVALLLLLMIASPVRAAARQDTIIDTGWRSRVFDAGADGRAAGADAAFEQPAADDRDWMAVDVPHNWQGYSYDRQVIKGSRHGTAWYRRAVILAPHGADQRIFLEFEGVNAYATVWLNGRLVGRHAGGLVSFTLDATAAARPGRNILAVRVDNPAGIRDLPWAPGDDSDDNGYSEGSQPFGIFRPVHVIIAGALRVQPFGVYAWGRNSDITADRARLNVRSEIENRSGRARRFTVVDDLVDASGRVVATVRTPHVLAAGAAARFDAVFPDIARPHLWSPRTPYLYSLRARILENGEVVDESATPYGIRALEIATKANGERQLRINGQPVFINGVAEYEHLLGQSHAFSEAQITARVAQVEAAGFNAFRDAHYPHNLRYQAIFERHGLMWWPQFSAHNWTDSEAYRAHFLALLADWVRERRNNPALFLWGLQNESLLPEAFARQASGVIRDNDPTASASRLITTCNGGAGTDWNVPQNWSGTYGGDPAKFADELKKQGLVGEYGAWRALGLHSEKPYPATGAYDESTMAAILGEKSALAASVSGHVVGGFVWLLYTHENPGRPMRADGTQIWDGARPLEHVGPANNKGLMTLWGEPTDAYYLFRAENVPQDKTPVVYIVSHTWPDRWTGPGETSGIEVYSNCDEVELFNDAEGHLSLGRKPRPAGGVFTWDKVDIRYNVLSATCRVHGADRARDAVRLDNLPPAPDAAALVADARPITRAEPGQTYLYRVNAGGPEVSDAEGHVWQGDRHLTPGAAWGWTSWADAYGDLDPALGSRRLTYDPIAGSDEQALFHTYRFGRDQLRYSFTVPDGDYDIELYFAEPWYGRTGIDATGWRVFDVAVNGRTVIKDLDIFKEAGFAHALKKVVRARSRDGKLVISFPHVEVGEAEISAIAVRHAGAVAVPPTPTGSDLIAAAPGGAVRTFLDNGDAMASGGHWSRLAIELLDSDWVDAKAGPYAVTPRVDADLYRPVAKDAPLPAGWSETAFTAARIDAGAVTPLRFVTRRAAAGGGVTISDGPVLVRRHLPSPYAPGAFSFKKITDVFEAEKASFGDGRLQTALKGYGGAGYIAFGDGPAVVSWTIETGLAGRHSLSLRYQLPPGAAARDGRLQVIDASGIVQADLAVTLTPGAAGDWQEVTVETPGSINAGDYKVTLSTAGPLFIDLLRFR